MIGQLIKKLSWNKSLQDLSLRWASEEFAILRWSMSIFPKECFGRRDINFPFFSLDYSDVTGLQSIRSLQAFKFHGRKGSSYKPQRNYNQSSALLPACVENVLKLDVRDAEKASMGLSKSCLIKSWQEKLNSIVNLEVGNFFPCWPINLLSQHP